MVTQFQCTLENLYSDLYMLVNGLRNPCIQTTFAIILLIGPIALNLEGMQITDNSALIKEISSDLVQLNVPTGMFSTSVGICKDPKVCKLKFCRVLSNMHNETLDIN